MVQLSLKKLICLIIFITFQPNQSVFSQEKNRALGKQIKQVEKAITERKQQSQNLKKQAESIESSLSKAGRDRIDVANSVQTLERRLSKLENEINELNKAEKETQDFLNSRRKQFVKVLMALQRIARIPSQAIIAYPAGTTNLIRTTILLRSAIPQIEGQADRLREDLIALSATRELIATRKIQLDKTGQKFKLKRIKLDGLIRRKVAQHKLTISKRRQASVNILTLTGQAQNLRELFANLEKDRVANSTTKVISKKKYTPKDNQHNKPSAPKPRKRLVRLLPPVNLKPFALSRGLLRYPAIGRISGRYGEIIRRGVSRKGLTIVTRASAQVVAPHDGKIVFAGNFRGYGQLLIIDHGEGYHTLLSGMARIDGIIGQYLLSGEPVGLMGTPSTGKPAIYIEVRRNSQPINPTPWLAQKENT